jgi:HD-GYP domain-containing protein (c-di-GMP phosphodiesterase class II)
MGYLPIRISTLKQDITLGFSLYLQLPHKTIKYIAPEDFIEKEQIDVLKSKKVRKLYVTDDEESLYQEYMDRCLNETMNDANVSTDVKAQMVTDASEATAERIMADPHSQKSYNSAQKTAETLIQVLSTNDELLKGIFDHKLSEENDDWDARMHKHAVNTSSLCISFAEYLKLPKEMSQHLGMAGLFHDVAYGQMSEDEKRLFFIPMKEMSAAEMTKYKEHPKLAAEILQDKDYAIKEVIDLILVHEERQGGNGFPNKLPKLELQQEIIALCSYYDQRVTCFNEPRSEVFKDLVVSQLGNFELTTINKFKEFMTKAGLK